MGLSKLIRAATATVKPRLGDLLVLVGLAAIVAGVALWSWIAALIVGGVFLVVLGVAAELKKARPLDAG